MTSAQRLQLAGVCSASVMLLVLAEAAPAAGWRARVSGQCASADAPVTAASLTTVRGAVLCLINQNRNAMGLPGLEASTRLNRVAERQTRTMAATGVFSHGADFALRFSAGGYDWRAAGENIAAGYATARSVVAAWMASPEHCRNILNPLFRDLGTGATATAVGRAIAPGTWTTDFGLLMAESPPSGDTRPQSGCPYRLPG